MLRNSVISILFVVSFAFALPGVEDVINQLISIKEINNLKDLNKVVLEEMRKVEQHAITQEEYDSLKLSYIAMQEEFNQFLATIKSDIYNRRTLRKLADGKTQELKIKYRELYNEGTATFNNRFRPAVLDIVDPEYVRRDGNCEGCRQQLLLETIGLIENIVATVREKREDIQAEILNVLNGNLFEPLKLPDWYTLESVNRLRITGRDSLMNMMLEEINSDITLYEPLFETVTGSIALEINPTQNVPLNRLPLRKFTLKKMRGGRKIVQAPKTLGKEDALIPMFESEGLVNGSRGFYLNIENSGFTYVLAYDDESNTVQTLFPYDRTMNDAFDIGINNALFKNPLATKNKNTLLVPGNALTATGKVLKFDGVGHKEYLCVLFSNTEIDIDFVARKIEHMGSMRPLDERVAQVFVNQISNRSYEISVTEKFEVKFNLPNHENGVIPMIFELNR